jgi:branched-chain amino acid transport system permease protein
VCAAAFGLLIERVFFSRLVGESVFAMVMVTIGLLILIRGVVLVLFGPQVRPFPIIFRAGADHHRRHLHPALAALRRPADGRHRAGPVVVLQQDTPGLKMTAVAEDHQVALSLGISVRSSIAFAWILGTVLSTLGAVIYLSGKSLNFLASDIGLTALPVALLAGLESIAGLLIAGIIVGVVQSLAVAYLDPLVGGAVGSILPFVIMLGILFIRPTGMFGWKTIERV